MSLKKVPLGFAALLLSLGLAADVSAQPAATGAPTIEFTYARPGYPTVGVYVVGNVGRPGKWRVEDGAPLVDLIAVADPETPAPDRAGVRERMRVRLYRQSGGGSTRALSLDSELQPLLLGPQAATPLREGDLVEVSLEVTEPRNRITFMEVLGVLSTLASLASLGVTLAR